MDNDNNKLSWLTLDDASTIMKDTQKVIRDKAVMYYDKKIEIDEWYKACSCGVKPLLMCDLSGIIGAQWAKQTLENKITVFTHMHPNWRNIGHKETTCNYCSHTEIIIHIKREYPIPSDENEDK